MKKFLDRTLAKTPSERGHMLGTDPDITKGHGSAANEGSTNPTDFLKTDLHFIGFVNVDGHLYEMDGTKEFPINHGPTTPETFLVDAAKTIKSEFVARVSPAELMFSVIALAPNQAEDVGSAPAPAPVTQESDVTEEKVNSLVSMGFAKEVAVEALTATAGKLDMAINLCLGK
mmetsp:Transcript_12401/g.13725  ORF Transcript_12401/g.13725 Transcript_12401/m.13725 type:complete len:173 (+) Transcript_12401:396-914(+)